jgi:hypothetical protein
VRRHAATILVLALLVGTAVAFAETERLKLEPTAIEESFVQPAFSPVCSCGQAVEVIRLRLHLADHVTVTIVDAAGRTVRVLVQGKRLPRGRTQLAWDGRDDAGMRAPDGRYSVDVHLARPDRTYRLPRTLALDTVAPTVRLVSYAPRILGRTHLHNVIVRYRVSEPAHGILFVDKRRVVVTYGTRLAGKLPWTPHARGRYLLQLAARDLAGNLGPRSPVFVVRVRR